MNKKYTGPIEEVKIVEKVMLTKEQADAIEEIKDKDYAINILALQKRPDHVLATLEISQIAKLLYGLVEYEIEPAKSKFEAGDKVLTRNSKVVVTLDNPLLNMPAWFVMSEPNKCEWIYTKDFRHATPEEIYWLETLGRDYVGDFREGDVYIDNEGEPQILEKDRHVDLAKDWYAAGDFKGIFPAASFKISTFN